MCPLATCFASVHLTRRTNASRVRRLEERQAKPQGAKSRDPRQMCELGESLGVEAHDHRVTAMTICRIRKQLRAEAQSGKASSLVCL